MTKIVTILEPGPDCVIIATDIETTAEPDLIVVELESQELKVEIIKCPYQ